jgi:hypothetical protein
MKSVANFCKVRRPVRCFDTEHSHLRAKPSQILRAFAADGMRTTLDGNLSDSQLENKL